MPGDHLTAVEASLQKRVAQASVRLLERTEKTADIMLANEFAQPGDAALTKS